jgi:hypothetical protein
MHPAFGQGEIDETYQRQNAPEAYAAGAETYRRLTEEPDGDWSSVPGWLNYHQFYRETACNLIQDGDTVAEIGVWQGRSIIFLAQELKRLGKRVRLIAVDTFRGEVGQVAHEGCGYFRAEFEANCKRCGVDDMIYVLEADSAEAGRLIEPGSLRFAYIDAAHDRASVCRDIAAWHPAIMEGGVLAGHDAHYGPVAGAVSDLLPGALIAPPVWVWHKGNEPLPVIDPEKRDAAEIKLSILTPSVPARLAKVGKLVDRIAEQIGELPVEHLILTDNKRRTIGEKRDALLRLARGEYVAFVDDDDNVTGDYVARILAAIPTGPDVVTFRQSAVYNGQHSTVVFRLGQDNGPFEPNGITRRNAWHVCAWRRDLAIRSAFPASNYGEDWAFAGPLCAAAKTEVHVPEVIHFYSHSRAETEAPEPVFDGTAKP